MWILESDADFLQGKRMWLKPGKKYLFGRVKRDGVRFAIDHKTISRKHFVITVDEAKPGDTSRIHARSRITITDEKSKQGTFVDGQLLKDDTRELTGTEHSIRPGAFHYELIIKWQPCILTFSFTKKELKADALKSKRGRLEELDVKVIAEYATSLTTHVVAGKRNTAKGLQALVQGKYVVADSFVDALVYAATPADLGEEENLSPLEGDLDTTWPKELDHLPPAGKEPTARPGESYAPNPARANVFENFVFVFGDQTQYDNLLPPITLGQGKALMYKVVNGETTTDELVEYMRNTAGHKGFGDAQKDIDNGGVIMVRWRGSSQYNEWTQNLINEVALRLDQRAIDQAEFLDAILANDAFSLRQTIPYASTVEGRAAPLPSAASFQSIKQTTGGSNKQGKRLQNEAGDTVPSSFRVGSTQALPPAPPPSFTSLVSDSQRVASSRPEPIVSQESGAPAASNREDRDEEAAPPPPKRSRLRGAPISKFADFDDGFDQDSIPAYNEDDNPDSFGPSQSMSQAQSNSYSCYGSLAPSTVSKDEPPPSTRKRRRSPSPSVPPEADSMDEIDEILPASTAIKKRKLELEAEAKARGETVPPTHTRKVLPPPPPPKPKKKDKEIDIREAARAQREQEEEAARKEREDLADGLGYDNDEKKPARLAVVVTMDLPLRNTKVNQQLEQRCERWDPKWNGRKNFKKFRKSRIGDISGGDDRSRLRQVIIPLVEVKKHTYGFGEKYWDHSAGRDENNGRRRGEGVSQVQTQSQTQRQSQGRRAAKGSQAQEHTQTQTIFGDNTSTQDREPAEIDLENDEPPSTSQQIALLQREAAAIIDHAIDPDNPRQTRQTQTQTQTRTQTRTQQGAKKRPASSTNTTAAKKKQKTIPIVAVHGSDSEDSDDLKFRFGARRKGREIAQG